MPVASTSQPMAVTGVRGTKEKSGAPGKASVSCPEPPVSPTYGPTRSGV